MWSFELDEPIIGFIVHRAPWTKQAKRYVAWKGKVRLLADCAGIPSEIPPGHRVVISIAVAWKKKARIDLSNVLKGIEDGLWIRDRGIAEIHAVKFEQTGRERVSVTVGFSEGEKQYV